MKKKAYIAPSLESVGFFAPSIMIGSVNSGGDITPPSSNDDDDDDVEGGRSRGFFGGAAMDE